MRAKQTMFSYLCSKFTWERSLIWSSVGMTERVTSSPRIGASRRSKLKVSILQSSRLPTTKLAVALIWEIRLPFQPTLQPSGKRETRFYCHWEAYPWLLKYFQHRDNICTVIIHIRAALLVMKMSQSFSCEVLCLKYVNFLTPENDDIEDAVT